jgi:hypothetical protein
MSQPMKGSSEVDERFDSSFQVEDAPVYVVDKLEEKKVVRKLDRVILPLMAFVYFFQCELVPVRVCEEEQEWLIIPRRQIWTNRVSTMLQSSASGRI